MDQLSNPYTPGSGQTPPALVGRGREIEACRVLIGRTQNGLASRSLMLYGLRGVGKTVLLKEFHRLASAAGWLTVEIEGKQDDVERMRTRERLARQLVASARTITPRRQQVSEKWKSALRTISSFSVKAGVGGVSLGVEIEPAAGRSDSGDFGLDIEELVADVTPALREEKIGFAVFVDEIQDLDETTQSALLSAQHRAAQNGWPFYVFGAGLPSVPGVLADVRSYAERQFDYRSIGPLSSADTLGAFSGPVMPLGVHYADDALEHLAEASGGYPFFIQVFGDQAWRLAERSPITYAEAVGAVTYGTDELDTSLFRSRWDRATPQEKDLLRAMAEDDGVSAVKDLPARMGKSQLSQISVPRRNLILKGLIYAPERGQLAYTVPHMGDFIRRTHWRD